MAAPKPTSARLARTPRPAARIHAAVVEEARQSGLLDGAESEHVSIRVPPALLKAAKREAGITSTEELGMVALALLAQSDPVAAFLNRTSGQLGPDHDLDTGSR